MSDETMIPCDRVIAQLWEYLDGDLDELGSVQVRRHLEVCARCFPEYDFRRAYLKFMRRCSTQQVPPELRRRVFETILEEQKLELSTGFLSGTGVLERVRHTLQHFLGRK